MRDGARYDFIDAIRGIAASAVLFLHCIHRLAETAWLPEKYILWFCDNVIDPGKVGVAVFFMVSGFVIPFSLKGPKVEGLWRFCVSRFFRLYPLYWLSIGAAVLVPYMLGLPMPDRRMVIVNTTMLQQFFGVDNVIGVYWTLQIELIFYAVCAALFAIGILGSRRTITLVAAGWLFAALAMALMRYYTERKLPVALPIALFLMMAAHLWRDYIFKDDRLSGRNFKALMIGFLVVMPIIAYFAYNMDMGWHENWRRYTATYYIAVLAFIALTTKFQIKNAFFAWTGKISYGIYLLHPLVMEAYFHIVPITSAVPALAHVSVVWFATVAICSSCFILFERPMISLGHAIGRARWSSRGGVQVAPADSLPESALERS